MNRGTPPRGGGTASEARRKRTPRALLGWVSVGLRASWQLRASWLSTKIPWHYNPSDKTATRRDGLSRSHEAHEGYEEAMSW